MNKYLKRFSLCALMASALVPASAADANETWKDLGTGQWRDNLIDFYYMLDHYYQFDVQIQESEQTPGRYRVVNPYLNYPNLFGTLARPDEDCYVIINASDPVHVYIEPSISDFIFPGTNDQMYIWSVADDYYNNQFGNWEQAEIEGVCGTLKDGCITFNPRAICTTTYNKEQHSGIPVTEFLFRANNSNGQFRLRLPDAPHVDVEVSFLNFDADTDKLNYAVSFEEDVEYIKYALVAGEYTAEAYDAVADGTTPSVEMKEAGEIAIDYPGEGTYTLIIVPFCDGKAMSGEYITRELAFKNAEWEKIAEKGIYKESILSSNDLTAQGLIIDPCSIEVEIERNVADKNRIRLVNPYGANYPLSSTLNYDFDHNYYMVFDVNDANFVLLETAEDGIGLNLGYGPMVITSRVYRYIQEEYMTRQEAIESGLGGKFANDEITFPENALNIMFTGVVNSWYWANNNGTFSLKLPKGLVNPVGVEEVATENAAPVYYRLDGTKVAGTALEPGLYIEVKGANARKIAVK